MFKSIKQNFVPFLFLAVVVGLLGFPVWSHFHQADQINTQAEQIKGDGPVVGASTLFAQNASVQLNLAVFGELKPDGATCSNGQILKKTGTDDWDCSADGGSSASPTIDMREGYTGNYTNIGSISFNQAHFGLATNGSLASLSLDWGTGGPASLSENETITGNWVNTANPWAVNEGGSGAATLTGLLQGNGTSAFTAITDSSTAGQVLRVTGASTYAWGALDLDDSDAITGTLGSTNIEDIYLFNSGDTATGLVIFSAGASVSTNLEVTQTASASFFNGSAFGGIDCNDDNDQFAWSGGVFTCGTLADADIPNNITIDLATSASDLTCTDCINATEIENIYLLLTGGTLTGNLVGTGASFSFGEFTGYASASQYFGASLSTCNATTGKLTWTSGVFGCGTDFNTGGGGGTQIEVQDGLADIGSFSSVSFEAPSFRVTDTTGEATVKLDWDTGPASKAAANTWSALNIFSVGASSTTNFEAIGYVSASAFVLPDIDGGTLTDCNGSSDKVLWDLATKKFDCGVDAGATSPWTDGGTFIYVTTVTDDVAIGDTASTTAEFAFDLENKIFTVDGAGSPGDARIQLGTGASWSFGVDDSDSDLLKIDRGSGLVGSSTKFLFTPSGASTSLNFEAIGYASASFYIGSAFTGVGDCNDATEAIGWTTTGAFNCRSVQDLDTTLTALATYNTNGLLTQTAADTFVGRTITGTADQITVTNGDGVSGNPTLSIPNPFIVPGRASVTSNFEVGTNILKVNTSDKQVGVYNNVFGLTGGSLTKSLLVGNGADTFNATASGIGVNFDGGAGIFLRDSTNNVEAKYEISSSAMGVGTITDHTLNLWQNNAIILTFPSDGGATLSTNFEAIGYASASKYFGGALATCGDSTHALSWTGGLFGCQALTGGTGVASNSLDFDEFIPLMTLDTNTSVSFSTFNYEFNLNSTGDFIISDNDVNWLTFHDSSGASISRPFEFTNGASVSSYFKIPFAGGGPTINTDGKIGLDKTSNSFNFFTTAERVIPARFCDGFTIMAPIANDNITLPNRFSSNFTVDTVYAIASSSLDTSTSVGFNVGIMRDRSIVTNLFSGDHNASSSTTKQMFNAGFNQTLITRLDTLAFITSSVSAQTLDITIELCGYYNN